MRRNYKLAPIFFLRKLGLCSFHFHIFVAPSTPLNRGKNNLSLSFFIYLSFFCIPICSYSRFINMESKESVCPFDSVPIWLWSLQSKILVHLVNSSCYLKMMRLQGKKNFVFWKFITNCLQFIWALGGHFSGCLITFLFLLFSF